MTKEKAKIGKYCIVRKLEESNYAIIYKVKDSNKKPFVLKVALKKDAEYNALIFREFQFLSQFKHPNIVSVYDSGVARDKRAYLILEYIHGRAIDKSFKGFSEDFISAMLQVVSALGVFHYKGFVHSDLKPENILYDRQKKRAVLIDFGFAGLITDSTELRGTIEYMAPEIIKGVSIDQRSDLYSLGVIMYEILSGCKFNKEFVPIKDVPSDINKIIARLTLKEIAIRPALPEIYHTFSKYVSPEKIEKPVYKIGLPHTGFVEIKGIVKNLLNATEKAIIIIGNMGSGKTRLLYEMKYKYYMQGYEVLYYISGEKEEFYEALLNFIGSEKINISEMKDRFQIYEEIISKLKSFAKDRSVVILVDDLQSMSTYNIELFRYVGYGLKGTNILLIGASRFDERVNSLGFEIIHLAPFSIDNIRKFLEQTFFEIVPTKAPKTSYIIDFARWLHKQSGGNPLFIKEILKTLYDNKIIFYKSYKWQVANDMLKKIVIPSKIEDLLKMRIENLEVKERELLYVLSLVSYPLETSLVSSVLKRNIDIEIEHLKNLGLLTEIIKNKKRVLSITSQVLFQLIGKKLRKKKSDLYCYALIKAIKATAKKNKGYFLILAQLYSRLSVQRKAYKYFQLLAKDAEKFYDYHCAINYYMMMLKYEKEFLPGRYPKTLIKVADLNQMLGNNQIAIRYYEAVLRYRERGLYQKAYAGLGKVYAGIGKYNDAVKVLKKALVETKSKEAQDYIRVAVYSYLYLNQFDKVSVILTQSFFSRSKMKNVEILGETMFYQSLYEWLRGNYDEGIKKAKEGLQFSRENKLLIHLAEIENILCLLYLRKGDIKKAQKHIENAVRKFKVLKLTNALANALNNLAYVFVNKGEFSRAEELYRNVLTLTYQTNNLSARYKSLLGLGTISEDMGRFEDAISLYSKAKEIKPDASFPDYKLSMVFCKKGEVKKSKSLVEKRLKMRKGIEYFFAMTTIHLIQGRTKNAEAALENGLELIDKKSLDMQTKMELLLNAAQFYYEKGDFENSLYYSENVEKLTNPLSKEYSFANSLIRINRFNLGRAETIDITQETGRLKKIGCIYDYAYLQRLRIESILNKKIKGVEIKDIVDALSRIKEIFTSIGAVSEQKRVEKLQVKLFPNIAKDFSRRVISTEYLNTFSKLAELISLHLGDEDFIQNTLDLIIQATDAERGALFIKTSKGMEFCAGRNIDKTTMKDARELSQTAVREIEKNKIIFSENALSDKNFNIKKSVQLNKIRSLLCIPLLASRNIIGALYLDSRIGSGIFGHEDEDFLLTVSRILASVIEKSIAFHSVKEENIMLKSGMIEEIGSEYIVGKSAQMKKVYQLIEEVAQTDTPVLLLGETGTGKGMLARLIHLKSKRKNSKFLTINCGTIPETLLESELFGHKRGAFTGAVSDKKGLLEVGKSGTIFLDEITNTSISFQAKLLEAIEEKKIRRLGETKTVRIDVRFLFATNKNLKREVEEGKFRKDLFYRINVFGINVPPLRERASDIPLLAQFFLKRYNKELNKDIAGFSQEVMERLKKNSWPGNVRELQNIIERAVVIAKGTLITLKDLGIGDISKEEIIPLKELKRSAVIDALQKSKWNIAKASRLLDVTRKTIYKYIEKYNIKKSL